MTQKYFRIGFTFVFAFLIALVLAQQPNTNAQGQNPFDTGGRDDKPAGEVFKNIQFLKTVPAGRLASIMTRWNSSLGVKCNHCHTPGAWEKDDLPAKQIAREMMTLTGKINNESLKEIKNLKSERPAISCYTCHRGAVKPETEPAAAPAQPK